MTPTVPDGPDTEDVERALAAADGGRAGHWPAVAAVLAFEVRHLRAVLARPAAGRDLTARDVAGAVNAWERGSYKRAVVEHLNGIARPAGPRVGADAAAELEPVLREEGLTAAADAMRARAAVARTDGQPPADEPRRCPMDGEPLIAMNAHRDGVTFYRHADGHGHLDARAELSAAPADDTAAPDPRPQLRSVIAELSGMLDRAMNHGIGVEYIAQRRETYMGDLQRAEDAAAAQPVRDSQDGGA